MLSIFEFSTAFSSDEACLHHLMKVRHGFKRTCEHCDRPSKFNRISTRRVYGCQWCGHQISPCVGTPMENSHLPLQKWFFAIYLFTTSRHGVAAMELKRQLDISYKTAWRMAHEIRKYMADVDGEDLLDGRCGSRRNLRRRKKSGGKRGRGAPGKTVVFGMLERGGDVMLKVVPNVRKKTLQPIIKANVEAGSAVHTDELKSYSGLSKAGYERLSIMARVSMWMAIVTSTAWKASGLGSSFRSAGPTSTFPGSTLRSTRRSLSIATIGGSSLNAL